MAELGTSYFSSYCDGNPHCEDSGDLAFGLVSVFGGFFLGFIVGTIIGTVIIRWLFKKLIYIINWWLEET